jgi:hypothetical protein
MKQSGGFEFSITLFFRTFELNWVGQPSAPGSVVVEVWDENGGQKDKFMGQVSFEFSAEPLRELTLPLTGNSKYGKDKAQGTMSVTVVWTSIIPTVNDM